MLALSKGKPVCDEGMPRQQLIAEFLAELRHYRGTLSGADQALLDALVTAGLGLIPRTPLTGPSAALWCSYAVRPCRPSPPSVGCGDDSAGRWQATPWGKAYEARHW